MLDKIKGIMLEIGGAITLFFVLIVMLLIFIGLPYGYLANVVKLGLCDFDSPYEEEILRTVGILVFPLGIIIGYHNLDREDSSSD